MNLINEYLNYLRDLKNLSKNTLSVYQRDLNELQAYLGKTSIEETDRSSLRSFLKTLKEKNKPITIKRKLTSIRTFFNFLNDEGLTTNNPAKNLPAPKIGSKEPDYLTPDEINRLLNLTAKENKKHTQRNQVAINILLQTGIRLSELTNLNIENIDLNQRQLKVTRKGGDEQYLPISDKLEKLLKEYIKNKKPSEPLIKSSYKKRITPRRLNIIIKSYLKKINPLKKLTVHSCRHTFCTILLNKKVDLKTIQILAGHKSIQTTQQYLHIANNQLREAVNLI